MASKMTAEQMISRIFNMTRGMVSPDYVKAEAASKKKTPKRPPREQMANGGKAKKKAKGMKRGGKTMKSKGMAKGGKRGGAKKMAKGGMRGGPRRMMKNGGKAMKSKGMKRGGKAKR
tara:strand:+ start:129 stop:479 length:351 start_codon:yes stop_codon:yes gene_type:complete